MNINIDEFAEIVEGFVADNFITPNLCVGCSDNCEEVEPEDHKGSYDKALREFALEIGITLTPILEPTPEDIDDKQTHERREQQ